MSSLLRQMMLLEAFAAVERRQSKLFGFCDMEGVIHSPLRVNDKEMISPLAYYLRYVYICRE